MKGGTTATFALLKEAGEEGKKEHDPSATQRCELRGHKWDMLCGGGRSKRMTTMSRWNLPLSPTGGIPDFNWITVNAIERHGIAVMHAFLCLLKQPLFCFSSLDFWVQRVSCDWSSLLRFFFFFFFSSCRENRETESSRLSALYVSQHGALPQPRTGCTVPNSTVSSLTRPGDSQKGRLPQIPATSPPLFHGARRGSNALDALRVDLIA